MQPAQWAETTQPRVILESEDSEYESIAFMPIPEPSSALLSLLGMLAAILMRRRRR